MITESSKNVRLVSCEVTKIEVIKAAVFIWNKQESTPVEHLRELMDQMASEGGPIFITDMSIYGPDEDHVGVMLLHNYELDDDQVENLYRDLDRIEEREKNKPSC